MIVVKVGGSLYDWPGLGPALRAFVAALDPTPVILVPGGGVFADAVRTLHAVHGLTEEQSHWLALESLWPAARFICGITQADEMVIPFPLVPNNARVVVMDVHGFFYFDARVLPHTWEVTTDSIAARAAVVWKANRLILLKSIDVPPGTPWAEAAARGWVDGYFTRALEGFAGRVDAVNLRTWGGNPLAAGSG